ncbi:MAG: hypothetical protein ACRCVL_00635, partial [Cetobacterium sp.]
FFTTVPRERKAAVNIVISIKLIYILRTRMMNLHLTLTLGKFNIYINSLDEDIYRAGLLLTEV